MKETRDLLDRAQWNFEPPSDALDRLLRRQATRSRNRRLAAGALAVVLLSAAGVGLGRLLISRSGPDIRPGEPVPAPRFTPADLAEIVLAPGEAPEGTEFTRDFRSQSVLGRTATDVGALVEAGFVDAYRTEFQTAGVGSVERGTVFLATGAILFEDARSASRALAITAERHRLGTGRADAEPVTDIPGEGLGEESFGFEGRFVSFVPNPAVTYVWRVGNAMFLAYAESMDAETLLEIAREMDSRAALRG